MAFYATVATVIPVLFIAIAVQGTMYHEIMRLMSSLRVPSMQISSRGVLLYALRGVAGLTAFFILLAGGAGEFWAIYYLYLGHDDISGRRNELQLMVFLIIMVLLGPAMALIRSLYGRGGNGRIASPAPSSPAERGTDKTDAEQDQGSHGQPTGLVADRA